MKRSFLGLRAYEIGLWGGSVALILFSFFIGGGDVLVLIASLIGATALIYVAKGLPAGQILTVVFALFYGYISYTFRYWGEMITYMGMTAPIAVAATVSWFKNPYERGRGEVRVAPLGKVKTLILFLLTALVTIAFYFVLRAFDTPNLFFSTVSVATSFLASALTFFRSRFYALAYGANDIVLIVLWVLATVADGGYAPMVVCFLVFLINDTYGFVNWSLMQRRQKDKKC